MGAMDADEDPADATPRLSDPQLKPAETHQTPTPASDLRDILRVTGQLSLIALALGLAVGLAWLWLVPEVRLRVSGDGAFLDEVEGGRVFARDGWFAVLAGVAGVCTALAGWFRHRGEPVPLILGLAIAGLLGTVLAWRLGVALGPDPVADQRASLPEGQPLQAPLRIDAPGVLFTWSIASIATVFVITLVPALFQTLIQRGPRPSHRRR
jgi:hypothetical protein